MRNAPEREHFLGDEPQQHWWQDWSAMTHQLSPQQTQLVKQDQLHEAKVGPKGHCSTVAAGFNDWHGPPDTFHGSAAGKCQTHL